MKNSTKIILAATLTGIVGWGGLMQNLYANESPNNIQVAEARDNDRETNDDAEDRQESQRLQSLAKITPQQAQQAAEAALRGRASRVTLDNEDGNLVYAVVIGQREVKVDAGNGKVLYTESVNQENDRNDVTHPRSSIQVPDSDREDNEDRRQ